MGEEFVTTQSTRIGVQALYSALRAAWRTQLGTEPSRASLLVLLSQWAHETDAGRMCMNFNLGGIKYVAGCGRNYTSYMTTEVIKGEVVHLAQRFRAYDSLDEAAYDYLFVLRRYFLDAWPAVEAGDVRAFAKTLHDRPMPYYSALEPVYEAALVRRAAEMDHQIGADTTPDVVADVAASTPLALADAASDVAEDEQPTPPGDLPPAAA